MLPRALARLAPLLALAPILAGCSSAPELPGASHETRHYAVATDSPDPTFARRVGKLAERLHERLANDFGADPFEGGCPLLVCTDRAAFDRTLGTGKQRDPMAIQGSCQSGRVVVSWPDDVSGAQALAHELVHRFVAGRAPDAPGWVQEGLARALALAPNEPPPAPGLPPRSDLGHPVTARRMPDAELWARLDELPKHAFRADPDFLENALDHDVTDCAVAAALVRFGLETQGFRDLTAIAAWKPQKQAFLAWLKKIAPETAFEHFPPLDLALDPAPPSSEKKP